MIPFVKMQGNGNDFIVLDNRDGRFSSGDLVSLARRSCPRRSSLGADGLLVVEKAENADFTMRLFNADGSEGEMCGNGARCVARYAFEKKIAGKTQSFSTLAGTMRAAVHPPFVELDMGRIPLTEGWFNRPLTVGERTFKSSYLLVGVPHVVFFLDEEELSREEMIVVGREVRHTYALFPYGANVNFVLPRDDAHIASVTYERGVEDLTDSCGTGSTASAIAWTLRYNSRPDSAAVEVANPGGINFVFLHFGAEGDYVEASLKGKTVIVAEGHLVEEIEG
jgi:diaminopimelate epimerase